MNLKSKKWALGQLAAPIVSAGSGCSEFFETRGAG